MLAYYTYYALELYSFSILYKSIRNPKRLSLVLANSIAY
jgi:hypothetical protein